jgi:hypothetical protein
VSTQEPQQPQEPTEEQLREAYEKVRVEDVLLQTAASLVNLAGHRLLELKDPEQAKLAIDAVRALAPLLPEDQSAPIREALSQLQLIYVQEGGGAAEQPQEEPASPPPADQPKSKIWTPGS